MEETTISPNLTIDFPNKNQGGTASLAEAAKPTKTPVAASAAVTASTTATDATASSAVATKAPRPRRTIRGLTESKNPRPLAPRPPRPAGQDGAAATPATPGAPRPATPAGMTRPQRASDRPVDAHSLRGPALRPMEARKAHPDGVKAKTGEIPVKIGFLGGLEQVGENMTFFEYKDDILVVDAGLVFPGGDIFGVDYIIPDISYIKMRKDKIKGVIITHGHLDHIGALKHVLPALGYPMLYATNLTIQMIKKIFEEAKILKNLKYKVIDPDMDILKFGAFTVESFRVNHNIPESIGFAIHTPKGLVVTAGDYKIDFSPAIDKPADFSKIARIGQEGVKLFLGESTNAMKPGRTVSERVVGLNLDSAIKAATGRLIIATFASNVGRVIQIIEAAAKNDKVVFVSGRSMVNNIEIVKQLGYINVPHGFVRKVSEEINTFPDHRVLVLCTGAQGEEFAALTRMSRGEDKNIKLKKGDQIMMSASAIPGNEKAVIGMMNDFVRQGIDVLTNSDLDIHASGHAYQEDIKIMTALVKPEYVIPIHGEPVQRNANKKIMLEMGMPEENVIMIDNGAVVEMYDDGIRVAEKRLALDTVMIDGLGMGHLSGEYVIKARKIMAEDGVLSLIFKVDTKTKELVGNIQIESRGFVYSSEVQRVHTDIVEYAKKRYYTHLRQTSDVKMILKMIKDELDGFIEKSIGRVPMLMPMFVYINRDAVKDETKLDGMSKDEAIVGMTIEEQGANHTTDYDAPHDHEGEF